jgi:integrase
MTFNDLAAYYLEHYATEAQYSDGRKVAGLRSIAPVRGYVETLSKRFGNRKLNSIRYSEIRDFQIQRLDTPVIRRIKTKIRLTEKETKVSQTRKRHRTEYKEISSPRQIASVNRELMTLRRIFNIAVMEGWISQNPFKSGPSPINISSERMRTRILTIDEEKKLLEICNCPERRHLSSLIVCLLDTGVRLNEALTLTWANVDLDDGFFHIIAFNSKTATPRTVPISKRLGREFDRLLTEAKFLRSSDAKLENERVFRIANNVNRSWRTARRLAGLDDLRIHDLRHTFGTRLDRSGFTQAQIARSLGHKQVHTTFRYTNPNKDLLDDIRSAVEAFHVSKDRDKE